MVRGVRGVLFGRFGGFARFVGLGSWGWFVRLALRAGFGRFRCVRFALSVS